MQLEPLVTVSASYGAGGSVVAPRLAEALGLPFVDRWLTASQSEDASADFHTGESLAPGEDASTAGSRILSHFARAAAVGGILAPDVEIEDDESLRERLEQGLVALRSGQPAVLLGRAGAVVLAGRPRAFHVRLDGPVSRRVARAAEIEHLDLERAAERQGKTDKARHGFVRRLYRADPTDAKWYHLLLDTTVIPLERAVDVVATAACAFFDANP